MTNTNVPSARKYLDPHARWEARMDRRADELHTLQMVGQLAGDYGIIRIGRFTPGGVGSYAAVRVLRLVRDELVIHTACLVDDGEGDYTLSFFAGDYYSREQLAEATAELVRGLL